MNSTKDAGGSVEEEEGGSGSVGVERVVEAVEEGEAVRKGVGCRGGGGGETFVGS